MFKTFMMVLLYLGLLGPSIAGAQLNPIIKVTSVTRTPVALVVEGMAAVIPEGTKISVEVKRINGKSLGERHVIKTIEPISIGANGAFTANLQRYGSLDGFDFPTGKYQLEFYAAFNRSWQSQEVARKLGVTLDEQGRSGMGEPKALPQSSDLVSSVRGGERYRVLQALRIVDVKQTSTSASRSGTRAIRLEIHDLEARSNPVRTFNATEMLFREIPGKMGHLTKSQALALVCVGDFNAFGYIANDLYTFGGRLNTADFKADYATTLKELCYQQEEALARRRAR